MSSKSRWLLVGLSTPLVIIAAVGGLLGAPAAPQKGFEHLRVFEDVVQLVTGAYVEEVDPDKIMEGAMRGLAESLDPSSAYLPPDEVALVEKDTPLGEGDPGLVITRQFYLRVLGVKDGSPAARAGLRSGDFVRAIDGKPTRDMSAFTGARMLRGAVGSTVKLVIIRGNAAEPHDIALVREKLDPSSVTTEISSIDHIGYLRIKTFAATGAGGVAETVRQQAEKMQQQGAKGLVIDIRNVADGSYDEAIKTAKVFIASGTIATRAGREMANKEVIAADAGAKALTVPVVVLQSFGTSGPAEVFAAAMSGNKRAELVGERTAGLAAEQHLVKLPDNFGLWMTYRRYFTNAGKTILEKGIDPDVVAEEPNVEYGETAPTVDDMRAKATERLKAAKSS
jgi:carboxyl-terminal processing protease